MIRFIVVLVVSIGCCFQSGCVPSPGNTGVQGLFPALESPVTTPVFCVYKHKGADDELDHIRWIKVSLSTAYSELPPGRSEDVIDWFIEYKPESSSTQGESRNRHRVRYSTSGLRGEALRFALDT